MLEEQLNVVGKNMKSGDSTRDWTSRVTRRRAGLDRKRQGRADVLGDDGIPNLGLFKESAEQKNHKAATSNYCTAPPFGTEHKGMHCSPNMQREAPSTRIAGMDDSSGQPEKEQKRYRVAKDEPCSYTEPQRDDGVTRSPASKLAGLP